MTHDTHSSFDWLIGMPPASPGPPLPAGVVYWDGDDEAEVCDVKTGTCGPAGGTTKSRLEEYHGTRS